jgi:hypothetical protein
MPYRYKSCGRAVSFLFIVAAIILSFSPFSFSQIPANRPYQPVIAKGNGFAEFSNNAAPMGQLYLYKYISASNAWEQIPFQFDEVEPDPSPTDPNRTTYFGTGDGNLDDQDELAFMARDAGDRALAGAWIADAASRLHPRYEIELADPLTPGNAAYVYLYRSTTLSVPPTVKDYVTYVAPTPGSGNDVVKGQSYEEGHRNNGINNSLLVPVSAGGDGVDFLDQLKLRFQVSIFGLNVPVTEENFALQGIRLRDGNLRIIRQLQQRISILGNNLDFAIDVLYYGYSVVLSTDLNITTDGVNLLRQSVDFDANVSGAKWYNQNITNPLTVDGVTDNLSAANLAVVPAPDFNWYMLSSSHGSFINLFAIPGSLGNSRKFYYHDAPSGTGDDTPDSGANPGSFGDSGLLITGSNIKGRFAATIISYMLGKDRPRATADSLYNQTSQPLSVKTQALRVAVQEKPARAPQRFALLQNSPNPLSLSAPATVIRYELPHATPAAVTLRIFNVLGQNVRELVHAVQPAGRYEAQWDGRLENGERAPAGIYFYQLRAGDLTATRKLMLLTR